MKVCALICTRNGRARLGPTLTALLRQSRVEAASFEVLVVDNGSTDGTAEFAAAQLQGAPFHTRVLTETQPGQMAAFRRGLDATQADIVLMVDDDNLLAPEFVATLRSLFSAHPEVGVIGSHNVPVFPGPGKPPAWFAAVAGMYACSPPAGFSSPPEPVELAMVAGAGCAFRRAPLCAAIAAGYEFINDTTREGGLWITGMDTEWCYLFRALGWKFFYDPRLTLRHVMTPERLEWPYARRLAHTLGTSAVGIDPFIIFRSTATRGPTGISQTWIWQAGAKFRRLLRHGLSLYKLLLPGFVGDLRVLAMEQDLGSLRRVLHERGDYTIHLERTQRFLAAQEAHPAALRPTVAET